MDNEQTIWITIPLESYKEGRHKVAVSLTELIQATNAFSIKNKDGCNATLLKSNPKEMYLHYNVKCSLTTSDPKGHDVKVRFDYENVDKESKYSNVDVKISCTCPAALYWGSQWSLHQRDALEGQPRPLLQAPKERLDLRADFVICKHMFTVLKRIIPSVSKVIQNIQRMKDVEEFKRKELETPTTPSRDNLEKPPKARDIEKPLERKEVETPKPGEGNLERPPKARDIEKPLVRKEVEPKDQHKEPTIQDAEIDRVQEEQARDLRNKRRKQKRDNLEAPPKARGLEKPLERKEVEPKKKEEPVKEKEKLPKDNLEAPPKARDIEKPKNPNIIRRSPKGILD